MSTTTLGTHVDFLERLHAEHVADTPVARRHDALDCGTCVRWASYAEAAMTEAQKESEDAGDRDRPATPAPS